MTREVLQRAGNRPKISCLALGLMAAGVLAAPVMAQGGNPGAQGYPRWSEFPPLPQNVPSTTVIRAQVSDIYARERQLLAQVAAIEWDRHDPDSFSLSTIARLDPELSKPVTQNIRDAANRFAAEQAARAVPPPLID
ncbi:hypothetical protein [Asticcacaulis tiandongensis]|uniref:hypothetical protein n=1 Tax=Asticcacaulis tiandongensis TaxID=2565365 RepID=UPI00112666B6|nr:hypothetical protein [Asticcacaulis tiandongensis]